MPKTRDEIIQEAKARMTGTRFVGPVGEVQQGPMTRDAIIQAALARKISTPPKQPALGAAEAAATLVSGAIAEPVSGIVGLASSIPYALGITETNPGDVVRNVQQAMTYQPRSETGRQYIGNIAETLQPATQALQSAESSLGERGYNMAGPVGGAIGTTLPTAAMEVLGLGGVRRARTLSNTPIPEPARQIIQAGERSGVPVRTTDVLPPETFASRWAQSIYEKIPIIGGAGARQAQQKLRQEAVQGLADEYGLELDSIGDLSVNMINSINQQNAQTLSRAAAQRLRATQVLDPAGEVPLSNTMQAIDSLLEQQASLGARADQGLISTLNDIKSSLAIGPMESGIQAPRNFSGVKDIRTTVIDDLKAINRSEDPRSAAQLQQVKSAIDKDMVAFAREVDPAAARDWLESNRVFARELEATRRTELRRAFNSGNTTPEVVLPILRGGRVSELQRLNRALSPSGKRAARSAILYDALSESGYFADPANANPDRFANALNRQNRMQAIDVFFEGEDKAALSGFSKLLNATRRAQQASANLQTGQQLIPFAAGGALATEPLITALSAGTVATIGRIYESAGMRNFLLRLNNTKAGSPQEMALIEATIPALTASLQSQSRQSQENE
jgi:hypothetical protein